MDLDFNCIEVLLDLVLENLGDCSELRTGLPKKFKAKCDWNDGVFFLDLDNELLF